MHICNKTSVSDKMYTELYIKQLRIGCNIFFGNNFHIKMYEYLAMEMLTETLSSFIKM